MITNVNNKGEAVFEPRYELKSYQKNATDDLYAHIVSSVSIAEDVARNPIAVKKKFPWWILAVIGGGAVGTYSVVRISKKKGLPNSKASGGAQL